MQKHLSKKKKKRSICSYVCYTLRWAREGWKMFRLESQRSSEMMWNDQAVHVSTTQKKDNRVTCQIFANTMLPRPFLHCLDRRTRKGNWLRPRVYTQGKPSRLSELRFLNPWNLFSLPSPENEGSSTHVDKKDLTVHPSSNAGWEQPSSLR